MPPARAPNKKKRSRKFSKAKKIIRSVRLLLLPDRDAEEKLFRLCDISMKAYNEINYERRQQFFNKTGIDFEGTYKKYRSKYTPEIGSATIQQVLNKNNEDWRAFFGLLEAKKEGKLPPFIKKVSPPGYKKRDGKRELMTLIRNDQYKIYDDKIYIHGLGKIGNMYIPYKGDIHIKGKQGRMQIYYDYVEKKWYAIVSFEVVEKRVRGSWFKIPLKPKGDLVAGIDVGLNNLYAVYLSDHRAILISGRPMKSIAYYYAKKLIPEYQSRLNKSGHRSSRRLGKLYRKMYKKLRHYINTMTRHLVMHLYEMGVSKIYVGYPENISQDIGDFYTVNVWMYRYIVNRLKYTAQEYGIEVEMVDEKGTSGTCPIHGKKDCVARIKRGLILCKEINKVFNADLAAAFNILVRGLSVTPNPSKRGAGRNGPETRPREHFLLPNLPALSGGSPAL